MMSLVTHIQAAHETERCAELLELNRHIKHLQRELRRARDRRDSLLNESEREGIDAAVERVIDREWQPTGSLDQETADPQPIADFDDAFAGGGHFGGGR